jgi:ATP-binding cassette subfamily B protein AbcA/BmrA
MSFNFLSNLVAVSEQLKRINSKLFINSNLKNQIQKNPNNLIQFDFDSENLKYSLKNISHKFENSNTYILKNINLDFKTGQKICITGRSGSGKSTLADILCGILIPLKGSININGINLNENYENIDKWKKRISYIPQNFTMISDKIIENIIFDIEDNNFDIKRMQECVEVAQIKSLLDLNYDLDINKIANKLSGGQKQRINIARGIYKKANLYIFDEITSNLDVITKKKVISSIFNFLNKKTILFITHDLSYLELFDKVVFLDNGKIEIEGSYDYVIKNSTKFREYLKQTNNY